MANPYSTVHNFNQVPLYQNQFDLLAVGLQAKEQGLAQGRDKVQQAYDQYANLDIYKGVDKEYAQDRLAEIMSFTDKYSSMDLSDPNLAGSIVKNYSQILDDNVINAISSTKLFKAEQAEWKEKKTKEPKLYNEGNHQFALSFSEDWRNSDQVGATYRGGGGFIEYSDNASILTETLQKAAKEKGYEYIETTPGNGVFREQVTKRVIDRREMQAVLKGAINPKMRKQMQIDAWVQYDKVPEEVLQMAYTQKNEKDINKYEEERDKYEALRNTTTDPNQRAIYDKYLNQLEEGVTSLNQNSYDKIGKVGAYNSLYNKKFEDTYLDAYSRAPYEVKREVNALDEATANYQMKVDEFNLSKDKFEETKSQNTISNNLRAQQLKINAKSLELKTQKNKTTETSDLTKNFQNPFDEILSVVEKDPLEGKENTMSEVEWIQYQEKNAYNSFVKMFDGKISKEDMSDPKLIAIIRAGGNGKDQQTYTNKKGKKVVIDFSNKYVNETVLNYSNLVLDDAPTQKKAVQQFNVLAEKSQQKMLNASKTGDIGGFQDHVYNFDYKIVGTEDNFKIVPLDFEKAGIDYNHYEVLLKRKADLQKKGKSLNWQDEASLDLYTKTELATSSAMSSDAKSIAKKAINKEYLYKSKTKIKPEKWYWESVPKQGEGPTRALTTSNNDFSNTLRAEENDIRYFRNEDVSSRSGVEEDIDAFEREIDVEFKAARGTINYNPTKQTTVVDQKENPKTWAEIGKIFPGKLEADYEISIIPMTYENGKPKGNSRLVVTDKKGDIVKGGDITLSKEQYFAYTGKREVIRRDGFDASFGEFVQSINLGNGSLAALQNEDGEILPSDMNRYNRLQIGNENMYQSESGVVVPYFSQDYAKQVYKDMSQYGAEDVAARILNDLENQQFNFKFEAVDGKYVTAIYKNGKRVHTESTGLISVNRDELDEIQARAQVLSRQAVTGYIKVQALVKAADFQK